MARITNEGISGLLGDLVFYTMDGKNYVRSRPDRKPRKKNAAKNSLNEIFGIVSTYGSGMTKMMRDNFLFPFKRAVYNRVRGWMRNLYAEHKDDAVWELSVRNSGMCQLNTEVDLRDYFRSDITVTDSGKGNIIVSFPELIPIKFIKAPTRTMKVNIKLVAVTSPFRNVPVPYTLCNNQFSFIYNNDPVPPKSLDLKTDGGPGDIVLVAMSIQYQTAASNGEYLSDIRWLPAAIITMGRLQ